MKQLAGQGSLVSEDLRRLHRAKVLRLLFRDGISSRSTLAASLGLTRAALTRITDDLLEARLVGEARLDRDATLRGRPQEGISLNPVGALVVGIGLGAFEQSVQVANLRGECLVRAPLDLLGPGSPADALSVIAQATRRLVLEAAPAGTPVLGATMAVAGIVDTSAGVITDSPNIGWHEVRAGDFLREALGIPVHVEAMHHVLNIAEAARADVPERVSTVLVNAAMGIGASVMERGNVQRGRHGAAGQIGHLRVKEGGELCTCGRKGCLDTVASGFAVLRRLGRVPERKLPREHERGHARHLSEALAQARAGDPGVCAAFLACGQQLGRVLESVRAVADPECVWLAGPLCGAQSFIDGVQAGLRGQSGQAPPLEIRVTLRTADAAAALVSLGRFAFSPELDLAQMTR